MNISASPIVCHIAAVAKAHSDQDLCQKGIGNGLVIFGIPSAGILFRCRAAGNPLDLEFGALLAALRFITQDMKEEHIPSLTVLSSYPRLVFALHGKDLKGLKRDENGALSLLAEYARKLQFSISYVPPHRNLALLGVVEYPAIPHGRQFKVSSDWTATKLFQLKPIQTGVNL